MTIKSICFTQIYSQGHSHTENAAFDYALDLAANHNAHLSICIGVPVVIIPMDYPVVMVGTIENEEDTRRLNIAKEQAEDMRNKAAVNGVTVSVDVYQSVSQSIVERFTIASRVHDLSVTQSLTDAGDYQSNLLEALLSESGGPVIIVPHLWRQGSSAKNVIAAWNGSLQAARALRFASSYLKPTTKIEILSVSDDNNKDDEDPLLIIAAPLTLHFADLTTNTIPIQDSNISNTIHNHANLSKSDLIIMGAYGHSKMRDWIFGGATQEILNKTTIPLFMAH